MVLIEYVAMRTVVLIGICILVPLAGVLWYFGPKAVWLAIQRVAWRIYG